MGQLKGLFKRTFLDDSTAEESTSSQETFEMSEEHSHIMETSHQEGAVDNQLNHERTVLENVQEESETNAFSIMNISDTEFDSVVSQELAGVEKTAKEVQDETCNIQVVDNMEEKTDTEMIKFDENNTASVN